MSSALILQDIVYVMALIAIGYPLGCYIYKIYKGDPVFFDKDPETAGAADLSCDGNR